MVLEWFCTVIRLSKVRSRSGPAPFCGPRTRTSGPGPAILGPGPGLVLDLDPGPVQVRSRSGPGHEYCGVNRLMINNFFIFYYYTYLKKSSLSLLHSPNWSNISCSTHFLNIWVGESIKICFTFKMNSRTLIFVEIWWHYKNIQVHYYFQSFFIVLSISLSIFVQIICS